MVKRPVAMVLGLLAWGLTLPAYGFQHVEMDLQFVAPMPAVKLLSGRFSKAPAGDVLAWLESQGVPVVIDPGAVSRIGPISASFHELPVGKALKILGNAMGGAFIERSDAWIFRSGRTSRKLGAGSKFARINAKGSTKHAVCGPARP